MEVVVQEDAVMLGRNIYELPNYTDTITHPEITKGKAGGFVG
jgi:hypothetical protein